MKITRLALVIISFVAIDALAQQDPMFTQYTFNMQSVNPGYAGSRNTLMATMISRWQWVGIEGAPTTQTVNIQTSIPSTRLGLGLSLTKDKIGPTNQFLPYLDVAYHLPVDDNTKLSFGLKAGAAIYRSDLNSLLTENEDNRAGTAGNSVINPNLGFGVYLYRPRFYAGFSAPKLIQSDLSKINLSNNAQEFKHYFAILGFVVDVSSVVQFKPSTLVKIVEAAPLTADLTASFLFYQKLWLGATYRTGDGVGAMVEYNFTDRFRGGYAYDYPFTSINEGFNNLTQATHEVMLRYEIKFKQVIYKTPRYF